MDPRFGEMLDASPEERTRYYALLTRLSLEDRALKVARLGRAVRDMARADISRLCPEAAPDAIEIELVARLYGREVASLLAPYLAGRG